MGMRHEATRIELLSGFERALDNSFKRVRENARRQWESRFAGPDPSDDCVNVRINATAHARLSAGPAAGFLVRKACPQTGKMRPLLV